MTLRLRFALCFAFISLILVSTFSVLLYSRVKDNALSGAENYLKVLINHEWEHLDLPSHQSNQHQETPHFKHVYLRIWKEGKLLYDTFPVGQPVLLNHGLDAEQGKLFNTVEGLHEGHSYKVAGYYDVSLILEYLALFKKTLTLGCLLTLLLIIPLSLLVTRFLLRPFSQLAERTSTLTAKDLSFRLPEPKYRDEYGVLAQNFNLLFDRLEKSFTQVRNFAVNASHEMRTPLSVIISQVERSLRHPPTDTESFTSLLKKILQSSLGLRNIINRLFVLAEVERLGQEISKTEFSVKEVVSEVLTNLEESYKKTGKQVSITSNLEDAEIKGNRELFTSIVTNLIENAIKYSKENILVSFSRNVHGFDLIVEDDGPGISPDKRECVFLPFNRGDAVKNNEANSHGLGLSIVRACVQAEKGRVELGESILGGLSVVVHLP